jgi:hypothetical protein
MNKHQHDNDASEMNYDLMLANDLLPLAPGQDSRQNPSNSSGRFLEMIDQSQRDDFDPLKTAVKEYIVTPRGMVGSLRTKWKGDLLIGRQHIQDDGTTPNDIVLGTDDLAVSREHCRIIYQDGFRRSGKGGTGKRMIPKPFFEFFKIFSDRHLANHPNIVYLPTELRMLILSYLRKPRNFYI